MLSIAQREALRQESLQYLAAGISIIPVSKKFPNFSALPQVLDQDTNRMKGVWTEYKFRLPTEAEVLAWADHPDTTGFAGVCGTVSNNLLCIDFDDRFWLGMWTKQISTENLNALPWSITARGAHLWIRCDAPGRNQKLAAIPDPKEEGKYKGVIETRAEGGYALLPPSLHPSGKQYRWVYGDYRKIPHIDMGMIKYWFDAAQAISPIKAEVRVGYKNRREFSGKSSKAYIIFEFNKRMGSDYIERCLSDGGYVRRGRGYRRPGGEDTTVYILDDGRDFAVSHHHNTSDDLHGKPRCAFDHLVYWEYRDKFDGKWDDAETKWVKRAAEMIGMEYDDPEERVMPQVEAKDDELVDLTGGERKMAILTDSLEAGKILYEHGVPSLVGPHKPWPRSWFRQVREIPNRFVCWTKVDGSAETTAIQMEAKVAEPLPPLPSFFTEHHGSLLELRAYLRNARQPNVLPVR